MAGKKGVDRLFPPRKVGERWEYMDLIMWPENGVIYIEDKEDGEFTTVLRPDWVARIIHFKREVDKLGEVVDKIGNIFQKRMMAEEWHIMHDLVMAMIEINVRAKAQGDPTDPSVLEYIARHNRKKPRAQVGTAVKGRVGRQVPHKGEWQTTTGRKVDGAAQKRIIIAGEANKPSGKKLIV